MKKWMIIGCTIWFWAGVALAQQEKSTPFSDTLRALVEESPIFRQGFTGFALYDPQAEKWLYRWQANKYFTPASNTKILTLFAVEQILQGRMPLLHYQDYGDTLKCWGTGDPMLLNPEFVAFDTLAQWLRQRQETTWWVADGHFLDERYGEGWSWDDYPYGYQMEKAALPVYGNGVQITKAGHLAPIKAMPPYFQDRLGFENGRFVSREEERNIFTFSDRALKAQTVDRTLPFRYDRHLLTALLQDTFKVKVVALADTLPKAFRRELLEAPLPDTLLRQLMHDSDNFVAEQLISLCSSRRYGFISTEQVLRYMRDTVLAFLPQPVDWVDGSGLSRYNQLSPSILVAVLDSLQRSMPQERLFNIFPSSDQGTLQGAYAAPEGATHWLHAKTGTLRHTHCLSGYIVQANGRLLVFSFMHNNYPGPIRELKREMERILRWIYQAN
ncbi:MAG: D-alanyl-D-alanine carboxypeptidase [Saprospiraceae bacterium]